MLFKDILEKRFGRVGLPGDWVSVWERKRDGLETEGMGMLARVIRAGADDGKNDDLMFGLSSDSNDSGESDSEEESAIVGMGSCSACSVASEAEISGEAIRALEPDKDGEATGGVVSRVLIPARSASPESSSPSRIRSRRFEVSDTEACSRRAREWSTTLASLLEFTDVSASNS